MTRRKPKRDYDNSQREQSAIAKECVMCKALLPMADPPRPQRTRVYAVKGRTRYCRCDNCGHTWKQIVETKNT